MAIYKPRRSRWPLLLGLTILGLILGFAAGALVVGNRAPDLPAAAALIADGLNGSAQLLEVTQIEYEEARASGGADTEFQGALDNLARARARYEAVAMALAEIDPPRVARISDGFAELQTLMEQRAEIALVDEAISVLRAELRHQ